MSRKNLTILRGTLDILILRTLRSAEMHGYEISRQIGERSGEAFRVDEGVLYPALRRMEGKGWLGAEWGQTDTGREARFYRITPAGLTHLTEQLKMWERYVRAMSLVIDSEEVVT